MSRFETEILTTRKNPKSLMDVPGKWIHPNADVSAVSLGEEFRIMCFDSATVEALQVLKNQSGTSR